MARYGKYLFVKLKQLKKELYTLYLAYHDPRVRWYVKILALLVIAYALSPIDIIPDFVPVLGYLDDLIVLPLGIYLVIKLIPREVMEECRQKAQEDLHDLKLRWIGLALVLLVWLILLGLIVWMVIR